MFQSERSGLLLPVQISCSFSLFPVLRQTWSAVLCLLLLALVISPTAGNIDYSGDGEDGEWLLSGLEEEMNEEYRGHDAQRHTSSTSSPTPKTTRTRTTRTTQEPEQYYNSLNDGADEADRLTHIQDVVHQTLQQTMRDGRVTSDQMMSLDTLVNTLTTELHQARTTHRSILNVIQERQDQQSRDLAILKDTLTDLAVQQQRDSSVLETLMSQSSNTDWAVADLKTSQDHLTDDVMIIKEMQEMYNETLAELDELAVTESYQTQRHNKDFVPASKPAFQALKKRVDHLQRTQHHHGKTLRMLEKTVNDHVTQVERGKNKTEVVQEHSNYIPVLPLENPTDGRTTTQRIRPETEGDDEQASAWEEQHNSLDKRGMKGEVYTIATQEDDVRNMQTMVHNLTYQLDNLENRLMGYHQKQVSHELGSLQASIANFTSHVIQLEHWRMGGEGRSDESSDSVQAHVIKNHAARIEMLENFILDSHTAQSDGRHGHRHTKHNVTHQIDDLQKAVQSIQAKVGNQSVGTNLEIATLLDDMLTAREEIRMNEHRIAMLEITTLNSSLVTCQGRNSVLQQEVKLAQFNEQLSDVQTLGDSMYTSVSRVEHSLSRLHKQVIGHDKTVQMLSDQAQDLVTILPEMERIQREVNKMIMQLPVDCEEVLSDPELGGQPAKEGAYLIKPEGSTQSAQTYCSRDENGRVWTRLLARLDGSVDFARLWTDYRVGFGRSGGGGQEGTVNLDGAAGGGEFWIGNANLHYLTTQDDYTLQIDMWDLDDVYRYARYNTFSVASEREHFALHIDGYSGNATDALRYSNEMAFSTGDTDNDVSSTHCAKFYTAGWWYRHCHYSNLNGRYTVGVVWFNHDMDQWLQLKRAVMSITRRQNSDLIGTENPEVVTSLGDDEWENLTTLK